MVTGTCGASTRLWKSSCKNPFSLDSKEPNWEGFQDYLKGEVRFASVMKQYPTEAADLFAACEDMAKKRYASYKRMAAGLERRKS